MSTFVRFHLASALDVVGLAAETVRVLAERLRDAADRAAEHLVDTYRKG